MKLKKWFTKVLALVLAVSLAAVPMENVQAADSDVVTIPDAGFRAYLCSRLGKEEGADITKGDLASLTSLGVGWWDDYNVTDITGLEYCTNLTSLSVSNVDNSDWGFLSQMTQLENLLLNYTKIVTVPDLTNLTELSRVELDRNYDLVDISGLQNSSKLTYVTLEGASNVVDISPLKGKTGITHLDLEKVDITEAYETSYMETISSLTNLDYLSMGYCEIEDKHLSMFAPLTKLETLIIGMNNITSTDFVLQHKDTLRQLTFAGNSSLKDNGALAQMTNLVILGLDSADITDFSFISKMPSLSNQSIRWAEWGEDFRTDTGSDRYAVVYNDEDIVLQNEVKNENGNLVAPVESTDYQYDATTGKITIPASSVRSDSSEESLERINYDLNFRTLKGAQLLGTHTMQLHVLMIDEQLTDQVVDEDTQVKLSVTSPSFGVWPRYEHTIRWYKDGVLIDGATSASLDLGKVKADDEGVYKVEISTDFDGNIPTAWTVSSEMTLTVNSKEVPLAITKQPTSVSLIEGRDGSLTVEAEGTGELSYQWYKGEEAVAGATTATYDLSNVRLNDAGSYKVVVTDEKTSVTSNVATVTVDPALKITKQPTGITLVEGESGSLSVTASGAGTLSYQWYKGETAITGATTATLNLNEVSAADAGTYKVVVSDKNGSITSAAATVVVEKALVITKQPTGIALVEGKNGSLSVEAVGEGTLSYQWYKGDAKIDGATAATLNLTAVTMTDAGTYKVVVSDKNGSVTSNAVTVVIEKTLKITKQPTGISLIEGQNGSLTVEAEGAGELSYQWYKGETAIPGETTVLLILNIVTEADEGSYKVVVTDENGSVTSDTVAVVVDKALAIIGQTPGITLVEGESSILAVDAVGEGTLSYQWYKDDAAIEGATEASFELDTVTMADAGSYKVVVSDKNGSVTSDAMLVVVEKALAITKQPTDLALMEGEDGTLSVEAVGAAPLSYQWYKGDEAIAGATATTLSLTDVAVSDAGSYKVVVTDKNGSVTSNTATVDVDKVLKIVKQPEGLTLEEGESGTLQIIASGEGTLAYQWYKDGAVIVGATNASLNLTNVTFDDAGEYKVIVSDENATLTSGTVKVVVEEPEEDEDDDDDDDEEESDVPRVSPKTGEGNSYLWLFTLVAAILAGASAILLKKKEQ